MKSQCVLIEIDKTTNKPRVYSNYIYPVNYEWVSDKSYHLNIFIKKHLVKAIVLSNGTKISKIMINGIKTSDIFLDKELTVPLILK